MRNIAVLFLLVTTCCLLLGCKEKSSPADKATTAKTTTPASTTAAAPPAFPSITVEEMKVLYDNCDYIDFIFYHMDFSMSVNDKPNVQRVVTFVDKLQPPGNPTCPAMGRIVFQRSGETLMEADMHYDKDCSHFVFYKDGKKAYINKLTEQGKTYFQQMFSRVKVGAGQ